MTLREQVHSPYNRVEVVETSSGRINLEVSGATHATWHPSYLLTGHAWDAITAAVMSHPAPVSSLLLLGLGGGTCLRQLRTLLPGVEMTAVEIDPHMVRIARTYMDLDSLEVDVVIGDAYTYLAETEQRYDVVIDDLYHAIGEDVERPHAITHTHLEDHLRHLNPEGSLVMNFVVGTGHQDIYEQACLTFQEIFSQTRRILPPYSYNEILVGSHHPAPLRTQAGLDSFSSDFTQELDREHWKELRTLKLRSR